MNKIITIIVFVVLFSGCGKEKSKIDIPKNIAVTKLSEILKKPPDYHEKKVLLEGTVAFVSSCHIVYQEGMDSIEICLESLKGFECPIFKKGQRIRVYAEITAGRERVIVSPLKIEEVQK